MSGIAKRPSTLDKYRKVAQNKSVSESAPKNEIRITQRSPRVSGYVLYAANLLIKEGQDFVNIKAAGNAIARGVLVAEIIRHRVPGLHQINKISRIDIVDEWEPLEEGLDKVVNTKSLPVFEAKLTKNPTQEELKDPSYQEPLPINEVQEIDLDHREKRPRRKVTDRDEGKGRRRRGRGGRGRGRYRGNRGGRTGGRNYDDERPRGGRSGNGGQRRGAKSFRGGRSRGGRRGGY